MLESSESYEGREQTYVKHLILRSYLERFAHIVGFHWPSITYIDGFSGPWRNRNEDFSDTSFAVALNELRRARDTLKQHGKELRIRCVFVEKDASAFAKLQSFVESNRHDVEILAINDEFENAIPEIIRFIKQDGDSFPFTLIDPTGYSGFAMKCISPLLKLQPGEVLINVMLEFIRRSIEFKDLRKCYAELFGTDDYFESLKGLEGDNRDDAIAEKYCDSLKKFCDYDFVLRASVLHPDKNRLNFQLIYATRHIKGVEEFKLTESKAMQLQEKSRANVEEKKKRKGGQKSFLEVDEMPESKYFTKSHDRFCKQAKEKVISILNQHRHIDYDQLWLAALSYPMVCELDLRNWLKDWRSRNLVEWHGLSPRGRELIHRKGHFVSLISNALKLE
jgi:three-Cys-motif partner protein